MTNNKISRIVAALTMAILAAFVVYIMDTQDGHLTREAYLAKQAANFDEEIAHPGSFGRYLILGLISSCLYIGLYETLSFFIRAILEKVKPSDPNN